MMQVNGTSNTSYGHFIPGMSTILETKFNDEGRHRRPRQWGKDARANNAGDLTAGNWRLHRRLSGWGVAKALETKQLGIGDVAGDLAAGEWKRGRDLVTGVWKQRQRVIAWGMKTPLVT
mgnify:CR=1 FL=1